MQITYVIYFYLKEGAWVICFHVTINLNSMNLKCRHCHISCLIQENHLLPVILHRQTLWPFVRDWQFFYVQKLLLHSKTVYSVKKMSILVWLSCNSISLHLGVSVRSCWYWLLFNLVHSRVITTLLFHTGIVLHDWFQMQSKPFPQMNVSVGGKKRLSLIFIQGGWSPSYVFHWRTRCIDCLNNRLVFNCWHRQRKLMVTLSLVTGKT